MTVKHGRLDCAWEDDKTTFFYMSLHNSSFNGMVSFQNIVIPPQPSHNTQHVFNIRHPAQKMECKGNDEIVSFSGFKIVGLVHENTALS